MYKTFYIYVSNQLKGTILAENESDAVQRALKYFDFKSTNIMNLSDVRAVAIKAA